MARRLSAKSSAILGLIADGQSYSQIVEGHAGVTYLDVFAAAREALEVIAATGEPALSRMEASKRAYANAYAPRRAEDDAELARLYKDGIAVSELSRTFEHGPGAIRARIEKLGLT